ncbi:MAG: cupin domain-containing protein [bacterium]
MSVNEKDIQHYFFNDEIEAKVVGDGVTRKVISYNDNLMVCEVAFETGAIGAMHNHPHEQCTYIVSGEFEFTIGEETKLVKAGDSLYKEPNIMHGAVCLKKGMLIDIFTPMRKDFL